MKYIAPTAYGKSFTCPHCGAIAQQEWWSRYWFNTSDSDRQSQPIRVSLCTHCEKYSLWVVNKMVFPDSGLVPTPNTEMPSSVKDVYLEAAAIHSKSPRGAAALLRLALQILCNELGEKGKNINDDVQALVKKGLPTIVQESLDIVRVTGNEAVHPGQIDTDDEAVTIKLFELINIIIEYMIAMPNRVSGIYAGLPAKTKDAIAKRDA